MKHTSSAPASVASVRWSSGPARGRIIVLNGELGALRPAAARGGAAGAFAIAGSGPARLDISIRGSRTAPGGNPTMIRVESGRAPFTFLLRDVSPAHPICIAEYGVAVTVPGDPRSYDEILADIRRLGRPSVQARIDSEPEETYEAACATNRNLNCPTWLGLSRDMRIFEVGYSPTMGYWGYVQPRYHSTPQTHSEIADHPDTPYSVGFVVGPGASCRIDITRRLEDGALPILRSIQREDDIHYHLTAFATLETQPLSAKALRGSEWQACYPNTGGNMLKPEERERIKGLLDDEMRRREEETVCWLRVEAVNVGTVPRYAWFKAPLIQSARWVKTTYAPATGFGALGSGRVFGITRLNGRPAPQEEMAVLIPPGGTATLDMLIPHQPIVAARARKLAAQDFTAHLDACRAFWRGKLKSAAAISVPEPAVDERIRAGLLHCDVVALGREPRGSLLATIGWYSPIGSESSPIIQFFDSMGWHSVAERSLNFFLDRQRADGFIQNFGGYQLETGPALWSMGEHFRYTRDTAWVRRIKPKLLKACAYLLAWRERNKRRDLRGRGYGLLDGKVADPEDFFHSFMLNGLSYLGIQRTAEMLEAIAPAESKRLAREARAFREDIRTAFYEAMSRSPVIPLGDGTWVPTVPPWAEHPGPLALHTDTDKWFTHGAFGARDSLIGSLYLVISEVLEPHEPGTTFMLKSHQELFTVRNAGLSQPYYCRHDHLHLARGEVKAFLKTYYNQFSGLQDRQTYSFWEHYFHASQHKTHEEGWFLMQTRWMLYREDGGALSLLPGIPRQWLESGKRIALDRVATYFGTASLEVESQLAEGLVRARIECAGSRRPKTVRIRIPHPEGRIPKAVEGGRYDPATESVTIAPFSGQARVVLHF